jgi:putative flavoprotein involved in K+ transport
MVSCDLPKDKQCPPMTIAPEDIYGVDQVPSKIEPDEVPGIVGNWVDKLNEKLQNRDADGVSRLFLNRGIWRDHLALQWGFRSVEGRAGISELVSANLKRSNIGNFEVYASGTDPSLGGIPGMPPMLMPVDSGIEWIRATLRFECNAGLGVAIALLLREPLTNDVVCLTFYTSLEGIYGLEPAKVLAESENPDGLRLATPGRVYAHEEKSARNDFLDDEPKVLIIGGGYLGLCLAAHLKVRGMESLIIEKSKNVGDVWRNRYDFLRLLGNAKASSTPYMPFPANFPEFIPKETFGDWLEIYPKAMDLNVWTNTVIAEYPTYDEETKKWTVKIDRNGELRELHPAHLIMSTGVYGKPLKPDFEGSDRFNGEVLDWTDYKNGRQFKGKNVVVVGCGLTGHDLAQDLYEQGAAKVTMIQRSSTYVMSQKVGLRTILAQLYPENLPVEAGDIILQSTPGWVGDLMRRKRTAVMSAQDQDLYDALTKVGYNLNYGRGGQGPFKSLARLEGGFYVDTGCCALLINGSVALKNGVIKRLTKSGIEFNDGSSLDDVDVIVQALGDNTDYIRGRAEEIFGKEVMDNVDDFWGMDEDEEQRGFQRTGQPGFWVCTGGVISGRPNSKKLALQILAVENGLYPQEA